MFKVAYVILYLLTFFLRPVGQTGSQYGPWTGKLVICEHLQLGSVPLTFFPDKTKKTATHKTGGEAAVT